MMMARSAKEKQLRYMEHQAKHPASKSSYLRFSPANWWADTRTLSLSAKALWFEILLLMHTSPKRGYLLNQDLSKVSLKTLAAGLGTTEDVVAELCKELEAASVFDRTPDRVPFSRRMVREQARLEKELTESKNGEGQAKLAELLKLARDRGIDTNVEMNKLQCYLMGHPEKRLSLKTVSVWMSNAKPTLEAKLSMPAKESHCSSPVLQPIDYNSVAVVTDLIKTAVREHLSMPMLRAMTPDNVWETASKLANA